MSSNIYRIDSYGDVGYYRRLDDAQREIRACGGDHATVTLSAVGQRVYAMDLYDLPHVHESTIVGQVIDETEVPERDRWQIR